jgi:hypothetical protein
LVGKADTNDVEPEIVRLLCGRHNRRFERSRAACARCRFVGPTYRGTYSGSVATSMPEAELDECRSYLPLVDRTARQHASDNSRRNRQRSKWRRRNFENPMTSRELRTTNLGANIVRAAWHRSALQHAATKHLPRGTSKPVLQGASGLGAISPLAVFGAARHPVI